MARDFSRFEKFNPSLSDDDIVAIYINWHGRRPANVYRYKNIVFAGPVPAGDLMRDDAEVRAINAEQQYKAGW